MIDPRNEVNWDGETTSLVHFSRLRYSPPYDHAISPSKRTFKSKKKFQKNPRHFSQLDRIIFFKKNGAMKTIGTDSLQPLPHPLQTPGVCGK